MTLFNDKIPFTLEADEGDSLRASALWLALQESGISPDAEIQLEIGGRPVKATLLAVMETGTGQHVLRLSSPSSRFIGEASDFEVLEADQRHGDERRKEREERS